MAANYWTSTQHRFWLFTKDQLAAHRRKLEIENASLHQVFPLPGPRELSMFIHTQINRLSKRLGLHQQPVATAHVFIKRFYSRIEIRRTNPYLVLVTALYLACKTEECPHHIRLVLNESRTLWPDLVTLDISRIGECEFFLISEMSSQLIIYQPYTTLSLLGEELDWTPVVANTALAIVNDHYLTDIPLLFAPHVVAMAAFMLAMTPGFEPGDEDGTAEEDGGQANIQCANLNVSNPAQHFMAQIAPEGVPPDVVRGTLESRFAEFMACGTVDLEAVVDCMQQMISFYECQARHNNKNTQEMVNRFVKARGLDK